jgi:predicted DNA-binding protein (UPF0251 family)/predicted Fe-Mo cluster-binding NifX family protein
MIKSSFNEASMPRPKKCRMVDSAPGVRLFKPQGIPARQLEEVYLPFEGYEALRLTDVQGLRQGEAAGRMEVSRQTFGRILAEARRAVAEAIVNGLVLRIEGGEYRMPGETTAGGTCRSPQAGRKDPGRSSQGGKEKMHKIAVSSASADLDGPVDPRFGRAAGFLIFDPQTMESEYVDNTDSQGMSQGAGIQTAELMARHGVGVVLTGYVGPKAFQALSAAGIKIGQNLEDLSVREAVDRYKKGQVALATAHNRAGAGGRR